MLATKPEPAPSVEETDNTTRDLDPEGSLKRPTSAEAQAGGLPTEDEPPASDLAKAPADALLEEGELSTAPAEESPSALAEVCLPTEGSPPVPTLDMPPVVNTPAVVEFLPAQELVLMETDIAKCASLEHQEVPETRGMNVKIVDVGTGDPVFQPTILEEMPSPHPEECPNVFAALKEICQKVSRTTKLVWAPWMSTITKTPRPRRRIN